MPNIFDRLLEPGMEPKTRTARKYPVKNIFDRLLPEDEAYSGDREELQPPTQEPQRTLSLPREQAMGGQLVPLELAPSHEVGITPTPISYPEEVIPEPEAELPKGPLSRVRDVLGRELTIPPYEAIRVPTGPQTTLTPGRQEFLTAQKEEPTRMEQIIPGFMQKPKKLSEKDRARATNVLALSQATDLPPNIVEKNYDTLTQTLGIRGTPTSGELVSEIMKWAIGAGLGTRPLSTIVGVLSYMGTKEVESLGVQIGKGEKVKLGAGRELKEFLPPLREPFESGLEAAEFLGPAIIGGTAFKAIRGFREGMREGRAARAAEEARLKPKQIEAPKEEVIEAEVVEPKPKALPPAPPEAESAFAEFGKIPEKAPEAPEATISAKAGELPKAEAIRPKEAKAAPTAIPKEDVLRSGVEEVTWKSEIKPTTEKGGVWTEDPTTHKIIYSAEQELIKRGRVSQEDIRLLRRDAMNANMTKYGTEAGYKFSETYARILQDYLNKTTIKPEPKVEIAKEGKITPPAPEFLQGAEPQAPSPSPLPEVSKGKEPWEMTQTEFFGKLPNKGIFDPSKPPISKEPISAVKVDTGEIYFDPEAKIHSDVLESLKIPPERVVDAGFIVKGKYQGESGDFRFKVGREVAAKRVEHRRAIAKALSEGKPVPPEVLKDYPDLAPKPTIAEPAPGMVRFYHGGIPGKGSRDVSPDYSYAKGYADKTPGGVVQYVDIPENSPLLFKAFDDTGTSTKAPYVSFTAPADLMKNAKTFPSPVEPGKVGEVSREKPSKTILEAKVEKPPATFKTVRNMDAATRLRSSASNLTEKIREKRNPAVAQQNVTALRAGQTESACREADQLENLQNKLSGLADAHAIGTVPESLKNIVTKAQVETILNRAKYPRAYLHKQWIKDILEATKGKPGTTDDRAILSRVMIREENGGSLYGESEISAAENLIKKAEVAGQKNTWAKENITEHKRMLNAGIDTEEKFQKAKVDLQEMGKKAVDRTKEQKIRSMEQKLLGRDIPGYFPTPKVVAEKLVEEADIQPGMRVLEPSAGKGNIADVVKEKHPDATLSTIEYQPDLADILKVKGHEVIGQDFLGHTGQYDRIVMNPPFENLQDIDHVRHAYEQLKPGGKLVSVMSPSPFFRSDKKAVEFREWLNSVGGVSEKLPEKSFAEKSERATGVGSMMVTIEKPEVPKPSVEELPKKVTEPTKPKEEMKAEPPVDIESKIKELRELSYVTGWENIEQRGKLRQEIKEHFEKQITPEDDFLFRVKYYGRDKLLEKAESDAVEFGLKSAEENLAKELNKGRNEYREYLEKFGVPKEHTEVKVEPAKVGNVETPKEQKKYLIDAIDEAIKEAPKVGKEGEYAVIEIPGDGIFKILNNKDALETFKNRSKSFPGTPATTETKRVIPAPSIKSTGKRIIDFEGEYYNEFKARKEGIIEVAPDRNFYKDGWYSNGYYAIKTEKPQLKGRGSVYPEGEMPDIKAIIPKTNLVPAEIVGENYQGTGKEAQQQTVFAHFLSKTGESAFANTKFVDSVLTKCPDAKPFMQSKDAFSSPILFKSKGEPVAVVMPMRIEVDMTRIAGEYERVHGKPMPMAEAEVAKPKGKKSILESEAGFVAVPSPGKEPGLSGLAKERKREGERGSVTLRTVPETAKHTFLDSGIEERFQKSVLTPETTLQQIGTFIEELWHKATRAYVYLPNTKEFAQLQFDLKKLEKQKQVASHKANVQIGEMLSGLDKEAYDIFTRKVILQDLLYEANRGHKLPWGLAQDTLKMEIDRLDSEVVKRMEVQNALSKRKEIWDKVKSEYITAMGDIGFKVNERFKNDDYFRHQVLEYANLKGIFGTGKKLKTPTGRGFLREREGSELDINRDFLQPEYEVMSQMTYDIEIAKTIKMIDQKYNIQGRLREMSKRMNEARIIEEVFLPMAREAWQPGMTHKGPKGEEFEMSVEDLAKSMFNATLNMKQAMGFNKLEKMAENGELPDLPNQTWSEVIEAIAKGDTHEMTLPYLAWLAKHYKEKPSGQSALLILKGISGKKKFIEDSLRAADRYVTWESLIPEGYATWQPREGNIFYMTDSIPAQLAQRLQEGAIEQIGLTKNELNKILAMGGRRKQFVVRKEVAQTLDELVKPEGSGLIANADREILRAWKVWQLISPRRFLKYNLRNLTGDADAVFVGNPRGFSNVPRAVKELGDVFIGKKEITGELKEWFKRGGMMGTLQAQEMAGLKDLWIYERLYKGEAKKLGDLPSVLWKKYWNIARLSTDMREGILRYSNYLSYLDQMGKSGGKPNNWGASKPEEILGLENIRDRAYWLSNDLLGAYDRVSVMGQNLRRYWFPFWSWKEVNFKRYAQFARNATQDGRLASAVGRKAIAGIAHTPYTAYRIGAFLLSATAFWTALQVWNNTMFPDEEEDLGEEQKSSPHIIFGRDEEGNVLYFNRIGALGDLLEWFGLDKAPKHVDSWFKGEKSLPEIAQEMAQSPVNVIAQGITPHVKVPVEFVTRRSLFPNIFAPGTIRDQGLYLARHFGLEHEYIALRKLPSKGYENALKNLILYSSDPGQASYHEIQEAKKGWLEKQGKGAEGFWLTPKGNALYNIKLAIRYEDREAMERYMAEYFALGGTKKGIKESIERMKPLSGLSEKDKKEFLKSLNEDQKNRLIKANEYFRHLNKIQREMK